MCVVTEGEIMSVFFFVKFKCKPSGHHKVVITGDKVQSHFAMLMNSFSGQEMPCLYYALYHTIKCPDNFLWETPIYRDKSSTVCSGSLKCSPRVSEYHCHYLNSLFWKWLCHLSGEPVWKALKCNKNINYYCNPPFKIQLSIKHETVCNVFYTKNQTIKFCWKD